MERTVDSIIEWFTQAIRDKETIPPNLFCEAGVDLNVLRAEDDDKVFDLQQIVARKKVSLIEEGKSVAEAKTIVEASDEYKNLCKQKAKCERITEFVRLSKIMSKLKQDETHGY